MESTPTSSWESHCPKPEKLDAFQRGQLPPEDVPPMANHLAGCPRCKAQVDAWLAGDTNSLKAPLGPAPTASFPEPQHICQDDGAHTSAESSSESVPNIPAAARPPAPPAPRQFPIQLGVYELLSKLGQGGMGTVYKAWHTRLKRAVALKTLPPERLHEAEAVGRFNREMEAVGKLDHPNIVRATDAGDVNGVHFLVMEYVEGVDLAELLRRRGPLPIADACALAYQAAVGLQYVHENGLVHRDVKPSNLMLTPAGQLKILDLGLALLYEIPAAGEELTASRQVMGTVDYMAPEQGEDAHDVDIRADIYSLGCTLYKLLTDHVPFGGPSYNTPMKKAMAHARVAPPPLRTYRPDVPQPLVGLVERMMAKVPARRFATPGEAADKLRPFTATANLPQLLATAREQAVQLRGEGQTPPVGAKGSKTEGRQGASSRTRPSSLTRFLVATKSRPWIWFPALAAVLMALTGAGVYFATRSEVKPLPRSVPAPEASSSPVLVPGTWHNLLDRQPVPLLWWKQDFPPQLDVDKQKLLVSSSDTSLLVLGAVPSGGYQYQLGVSQPRPWTGGVGLFFGCHKDVVEGRPCFTYQSIQLMSRGPGNDKSQAFRLLRMKGTIFLLEGGGRSAGTSILKEQIVPAPTSTEQILEIAVSAPGRLFKVRWGGQEMPDLVSPQVNAFFKESDYAGEFGVVNVNSSCVYANARILLNEKEE